MEEALDASAVGHEGLPDTLKDAISSLASDAMALRGMSSLLAAVQSGDEGVLQRWDHLNHAVEQMEEKVDILRGIVSAEQQALRNLERLDEEADRRKELLERLQEKARARKILSKHDGNVSPPANASASSKETASPHRARQLCRDSLDPRSQVPPTTPVRRPSNFEMQSITQAELEEVPRTIKGRISLPVMNDAVADIERVIREKYAKKRPRSPWQPPTEEDESDEACISEQDLRQTCAFFRSQEATARVILMILRTLGRLKQVPRKDGLVMYTLPSPESDDCSALSSV